MENVAGGTCVKSVLMRRLMLANMLSWLSLGDGSVWYV